MNGFATDAYRVSHNQCPACVRHKPNSRSDCPIRRNLLSETMKAGDDERAKFIRNGKCRYFENKIVI